MRCCWLPLLGGQPGEPSPPGGRRWIACPMLAYQAYRSLVFETPGFMDFWQAATPMDEIKRLQIGSRPQPARQAATGGDDPRHPLGIFLDAEPLQPAGLVRFGQRPGARGPASYSTRCTPAGLSSARCWKTPRCRWSRQTWKSPRCMLTWCQMPPRLCDAWRSSRWNMTARGG